jgi:pectate lyase
LWLALVSVAFPCDGGEPLVGWASIGGKPGAEPKIADPPGKGTTGGGDGPTYAVANAKELIAAMKRSGPKTVLVRGSITLEEDLRLTSDTTLAGAGAGATIMGAGLNVRQVSNVIVRNLTIHGAVDAINSETSDHVWIDHCDLSRCRDGSIDIKRGSDYVTVSWNRFHDHHKTCLLGHSDKPDVRALDRGKLRVTYHHNFFDGTKTRHPRVRFAEGVHVFNNLYRDCDYGVAAVMDAAVLVEGNVFDNVSKPTLTGYGDSPDPADEPGAGLGVFRLESPQLSGELFATDFAGWEEGLQRGSMFVPGERIADALDFLVERYQPGRHVQADAGRGAGELLGLLFQSIERGMEVDGGLARLAGFGFGHRRLNERSHSIDR